MSKIENNIGWCDETTNGVTGCDKVSPGCKNCYAAVGTRARVLRHRKVNPIETWGANGQRVAVNFEPVFRRLNKLCICDKCHETMAHTNTGFKCISTQSCTGKYRRPRLFADSNSDWLDPKWPAETLAAFLDAIRTSPNLDVLLLTKRIENFSARLKTAEDCEAPLSDDLCEWIYRWWKNGEAPQHVWLGVSVEDQKRADERIPMLLQTPAAVRFLSAEPLLEPVDLKLEAGMKPSIDWVIVGGESGDGRRDCGVESIKTIVRQCSVAGVSCYVKQDVAFHSGQQGRIPDEIWNRKEFPR